MMFMLITSLVAATFLYAQDAHYKHLERKQAMAESHHFNTDIDKMWRDVQDYKKRVDALTLKAGFKL